MPTHPARNPVRGRSGRSAFLDPSGSAHELDGSGEHLAEDARDLVELGLTGDERWRDLDHRIATVVRAADHPGIPQRRREVSAEELLALVVGERLARVLVLDQLDRPEESGATQVADD